MDSDQVILTPEAERDLLRMSASSKGHAAGTITSLCDDETRHASRISLYATDDFGADIWGFVENGIFVAFVETPTQLFILHMNPQSHFRPPLHPQRDDDE